MTPHHSVTQAGHAKDIARRWVREEASRIPGAVGAFFHGSITSLPNNETLPATSDVDVMVVLDGPEPPPKPGKFLYRDVMLEVSYLPAAQVRTPELVLGQYHLAGSFRAPGVIWDSSGRLTALQSAVARDYAKRRWVQRRCEHARDKMLGGFPLDETDPFPDQVNAWLFPAAITTHVLLVAGLRNPTVRTRYIAARRLLTEYGHRELYAPLLALLGCAGMSQARAAHHLAALTEAFDAAKSVVKTPFLFVSDISDTARPIAIDGSRELIDRGDHREAIFWMVATWTRCQMVFAHDAPAMAERYDRGYRELLGDLGIASFADLQRGKDQIAQFTPRLWDVAQAILAANPDIEVDD
ncbi:MAG: hypothetical protein H0T18_07370 [Chloroflexia bacterium]|nr:hypothetical protein [Chloroflexia bacterium]